MRESGNLLMDAVHSFRRKRVAPDGQSGFALVQRRRLLSKRGRTPFFRIREVYSATIVLEIYRLKSALEHDRKNVHFPHRHEEEMIT